ncbi:hypothetical protein [Thermogymnomonas acidicola]|uniref:isocitrate/isopropylmalate family dehydrogenase n=1 Tax=Thermogymnomonas acidicola TaxID=399579 RepID=UPI000946635A|nr:isocitrate/isopropylmalate family dehydrogenase [Thermogymnomonas acidicola]
MILNLRATLDLFANVRPVRSFVTGRELVVFRENTQEFYVGIGGGDRSGIERPLGLYGCEGTIGVRLSVRGGNMAFDIGIMSEAHLRRFFSRLSIYRGGRKITVTDKANAVPNMYSLWRSVAAEVLQRDGFEFTFQYADSVAYDMARNPEKYEVIVAPNLYGGDILSDLAAGLFHGLGFAPSANIGDRRPGLFEPVHGSAPDIAGKDIANPFATILAASMLLEYNGHPGLSKAINDCVAECYRSRILTPDAGGKNEEFRGLQGIHEKTEGRSMTTSWHWPSPSRA